jgi:hypothetical protein
VLAEGNATALPLTAPIAETIPHGQHAKDVEPKGLRKIEVNHDTDKAEGKKKHPALARSETHDIGTAGGTEEEPLSIREESNMFRTFITMIKGDLL